MVKIVYEYPKPKVYIFCEMKGQRTSVEVCEICPYIKGCSDYMEYVQTKNKGE